MNYAFRTREVCKYLAVILLAAGSSACDKEGFSYDDPNGGNNLSNYAVTDTLTLEMKTLRLDSTLTSGMATLLCGQHNDPYFGRSSAHTYFQLQLPTDKTLEDEAIYDSLQLRLPMNSNVYGDTALTQHIGVYRVEQDIRLPENGYALFSHYTFRTGSTALGALDRAIRPSEDTLVTIKLTDDLGRSLFQLLRNKSSEVFSQDEFLQYFKGLSLKSGNGSASINSFKLNDSLVMRLYYHFDGLEITYKHLDFTTYNPNLQFNHIETDRSGTLLSALSPTHKTIPSSQTGNMTFVQSLSQVVTRIDIPGLKSLPELGKFFKIMRATLTVRPVGGTYTGPYTLPPRLTLCETDNLNNITDTLVSPNGTGVQYGDLTIDNLYNLNTTYTYDITGYCIAEANSNSSTTRGLLLIPTSGDFATNFNRAVIGDKWNKNNKISIQVYYLAYNNSQK